jgi:YVTN family beta-propeller protein
MLGLPQVGARVLSRTSRADRGFYLPSYSPELNAVEVLDPVTDKIVAKIPTGSSPHYVNHPRNTNYGMAIEGPGELLLFNPQTNQPVHSIKVGAQPHWLALSADGTTAYVTNEGTNTLSVIDMASGKVTTIAVGGQQRKVVVQPTGKSTLVTIDSFTFAPPLFTNAAGETVVWHNHDGSPHAVAFKDGSGSMM